MSILDFFKKDKAPTFKEYASNKHLPAEMISKEQNSEFYKNQLVSLTSAYFLHQAVCASASTGLPVTTNLAQNANRSWGIPAQTANPNSIGIYSFVDYCNAVSANPHLNNVGCSHNQNIFAHNLLHNPNVNFQELSQDISTISTVHEAVLATFAGTTKDLSFGAEVDTSTLQFISTMYARNPQTTFNDDYFAYPDGQFTENAKISTDQISAADPNAVGFALEILTRASGVFQQTVYENSADFAIPAVQE